MIRRFALLVVMLMAACPGRTRRTLVPKVPTHGDSAARTRFERAQSQFRRDADSDASEFTAIAEEYPNDPIAPYALLYAGIAALRAGDYAEAVARLDKLDGEPSSDVGLRARGDLYLGLAHSYQGNYAVALPLLARAEAAIADDYERGEWIAALAEASGRGQRPLDALAYYDRWYGIARAGERAYVVARLEAIVGAASERDALYETWKRAVERSREWLPA
jgi:tetratricopeptide (TPR) repeat protein